MWPHTLASEADGVDEITVLVIDEHNDVRALLARGLDGSSPLRVVASTGSALEGMDLAAKSRPQIILVDLKMPARYRAEVYRRIHRASPGSRLIVYTSYLSQEEERVSLESGVCKCLLKGMSIRDLAAELRSLAESSLKT